MSARVILIRGAEAPAVGNVQFGPGLAEGSPLGSLFNAVIPGLAADAPPPDAAALPETNTLQVWLNATEEPYEFETELTAEQFVDAVDRVLEDGTRWVLAGDFYLRSNQIAAVTRKPGGE